MPHVQRPASFEQVPSLDWGAGLEELQRDRDDIMKELGYRCELQSFLLDKGMGIEARKAARQQAQRALGEAIMPHVHMNWIDDLESLPRTAWLEAHVVVMRPTEYAALLRDTEQKGYLRGQEAGMKAERERIRHSMHKLVTKVIADNL